MEAVSTFERIRAVNAMGQHLEPGRPTLCSEEIATKILQNLAAGAYVGPACEAAGVSYHAVRKWLIAAREDKAEGNLDSPYVKFSNAIAHAEAAAEPVSAQKDETLGQTPDEPSEGLRSHPVQARFPG